jgi:hypothetical protein
LLKAAGVKPAGAEAMVRDHLDEIQGDTRHYHAELIASVKKLETELVELQHNHASSVSEIRMATDLMRREIEARSISFDQTLKFAKFVLIILVALQVIVLASLQTTIGSKMPDIGDFIPSNGSTQEAPAPLVHKESAVNANCTEGDSFTIMLSTSSVIQSLLLPSTRKTPDATGT